jgi:hypothetical protein
MNILGNMESQGRDQSISSWATEKHQLNLPRDGRRPTQSNHLKSWEETWFSIDLLGVNLGKGIGSDFDFGGEWGVEKLGGKMIIHYT